MDSLYVEVCSDAIRRFGATSHAVEYCRGLFPTKARQIFKDLSGTDPFREEEVPRALKAPSSRFGLSQWFFDTETIKKIENRFAVSSKQTVCLGVPSLAGPNYPRSLLIDLDARRVSGGITADIDTCDGGELPKVFEICVADPPWYLDHYLHWMQVARRYLRKGAQLLMPLLGELTRPSAAQERSEILSVAESLGFDIEVLQDFCRYETPDFELAMLCRKGIFAPHWKRADLLILTASSDPKSVSMKSRTVRKLSSVVKLENVVFEVMHSGDGTQGDALLAIPGGLNSHIMDTPSARDPKTVKSNVFTSNGFRFFSDNTVELVHRLRGAENFDLLIDRNPDIGALLSDIRDDHERWFGGVEA
jgi:hypothetical protein